MALSRQRQREIMRADEQRRQARELQELRALSPRLAPQYPRGGVINRELVSGIGVISPPLQTRASRDSWHRGMSRTRTVGTALDDAGMAVLVDGAPTVKVTRDGLTIYVPASAFSKRTTRAPRKTAPQKGRGIGYSECAKLAPTDLATADGTA